MALNDARLALLQGWLSRDLGLRAQRIERASSDASFRRYFRVLRDDGTLIVMDAPPETEDVRPYLRVTALLEPLGIHVPHVYESDVARGFVLLEDLGSTHYLAMLGAAGDAQRLYGD
ncbi:MAG: phosphotransferase, partial [Steroidobacteraceae bacterium]